MQSLVAAREAGDSLFIISDLGCLRYRTLRALYSHIGWPNLGFRSAPPQALCFRRAPRADADQIDQLDQNFLKLEL